jgi:predicted ester cyclase
MTGDDLFGLMSALGWLVDLPSFAPRADRLVDIVTSAILQSKPAKDVVASQQRPFALPPAWPYEQGAMMMLLTRDELVARLVRAGELEVSGEDQAETDSYFDTAQFRFHGPAGFEADYAGLTNYFRSIRAAFDDRSIRRGIIIVEGNQVACQTWIEGRFVREFTQSPAGLLPPNGQRVVFDLSNIFRFDNHGRLVEEWVRTDYRSFLRQLGAEGR